MLLELVGQKEVVGVSSAIDKPTVVSDEIPGNQHTISITIE
jgi:hypothetical protein